MTRIAALLLVLAVLLTACSPAPAKLRDDTGRTAPASQP